MRSLQVNSESATSVTRNTDVAALCQRALHRFSERSTRYRAGMNSHKRSTTSDSPCAPPSPGTGCTP